MVSKIWRQRLSWFRFWYVRNDAFDARNPFDVCTTARCKPGKVFPISLCRFVKTSLARLSLVQYSKTAPSFQSVMTAGAKLATLALSYVPTAAEINGDFTNTPSGAGFTIHIPRDRSAITLSATSFVVMRPAPAPGEIH